jgi:hypothetical protein
VRRDNGHEHERIVRVITNIGSELHAMAENRTPGDSRAPGDSCAPGRKDVGDGPTQKLATFAELVAELNRHLLELEYALLDLKEALLRFDRREREGLERAAATQIERIRRK